MKHLYHDLEEQVKQKPLFRFLLAAVVTLLLFIPTYCGNYVTYTTTDDACLMQILQGCFNSAPMPWTLFISPVLCRMFQLLYNLFPNVPCYPLLQIFSMYVSIVIINQSILKICLQYKHGIVKGLCVMPLLFFSTLHWMLVRMHFYYVALLAGTAAVTLIFTLSFEGRKWIIPSAGILLEFLVCFLWSIDTSYALLCFAALALAARIILNVMEKQSLKKAIVYAAACIAVAVVLIAGLSALFRSERVRFNGEDYVEWNSYRVSYWDYGSTPYAEDPALYENVDWSSSFYTLTKKMYFMDERFGTEELSQIVNKFNRTDFSTEGRTLDDTLETAKSLYRGSPVAKGLFFLICGLFAVSLLTLRLQKRQFFRVAVSVCSACGAGILCLYLCFRGRFPLRAFSPVAVPCITLMTLNLIDLFHGFLRTERKPRYLRLTAYRRTCAIRACALCVLLVFTIGMNAFSAKQVRLYLEKESLKDYYAHHHETEAVVYDYVSTHKDGIYVFDWTLMSTYDPFPGLKTGDLNNLFCWGGARQFTYAYNDQLVLNGLDDLYSDAFLNDGVYLLTGSGDSIVQLLLFLNEEYGAKYAAFVDTLDKGVNVIRFLPEVSDAELLTQNYEQIWICEGQAVNPYTPVS